MENQIDEGFWQNRLNAVKKALEKNTFEVYTAQNQVEAKDIVLKRILPKTGARRI